MLKDSARRLRRVSPWGKLCHVKSSCAARTKCARLAEKSALSIEVDDSGGAQSRVDAFPTRLKTSELSGSSWVTRRVNGAT